MEREGGVQKERGKGSCGSTFVRFSGKLGPVGEVARLI